MRRITLAAVGLLAVAATAPAQPKLPPDLALVPGDAIGFLHVKVAEGKLASAWRGGVTDDNTGIIRLRTRKL